MASLARRLIMVSALFSFVLLAGCKDLGKVDQGRVIAYDKEKKTCTIIRDISRIERDLNATFWAPEYKGLPPVTYQLPSAPREMGPEPRAGYRMKLDIKANQIILFDPVSVSFKTISYTPLDQQNDISKENPLVYDKATKQPKIFPVIDRQKKTITLYSPRQQTLVTFSIPDEYMALPDYAWEAGDEVRIYYKESGKASRFMNITQTDIYKK